MTFCLYRSNGESLGPDNGRRAAHPGGAPQQRGGGALRPHHAPRVLRVGGLRARVGPACLARAGCTHPVVSIYHLTTQECFVLSKLLLLLARKGSA